jgi:protein-L-isoaspartate O-methyltransferase
MAYVHGYSDRETQRLQEQSLILEELLHSGTSYAPGSRVLEVGCGVGAQTLILLRRNPHIRLTSIDISEESVRKACSTVETYGYENVNIRQDDIMNHTLETGYFDHLFVCFLLEHLESPALALKKMMGLLREGGTLTLIEGDHGSGIWTPESKASRAAWDGLITSQRMLGHDPDIGRRLYPLMKKAGIRNLGVEPRPVYADQSDPVLLDGVVNQIITPMVYSSETHVLDHRLVDPATWKRGLKDLSNVATHDEGTFFYTWFKGVGTRG